MFILKLATSYFYRIEGKSKYQNIKMITISVTLDFFFLWGGGGGGGVARGKGFSLFTSKIFFMKYGMYFSVKNGNFVLKLNRTVLLLNFGNYIIEDVICSKESHSKVDW